MSAVAEHLPKRGEVGKIWRWSHPLSKADYVEGLSRIAGRMSDLHRRLLVEQYHAPNRQVTAPQLARLAEIKGGYPAVNLQYGTLGRMFCDETGAKPDVQHNGKDRLWSVWSIGWKETEGFVWQMLPQVAEALEILGWVGPQAVRLSEEITVSEKQLTEGAVCRVLDRRTKATQNRDKAVRLNKAWGVGAAQVRYSNDGHWYATLTRFPAALFDAHGYVLFATEAEYRASPHLSIGKQISVPEPGISAIPGYVRVADKEAEEHLEGDDGRHALAPDEADQAGPCDPEGYSPDGIDRRPLVERQIRERRGQREFRDALRQRYGDHCLVTGCKVLAVLEAAHIKPHRGQQDNHPENGLLLRSDIHTLFDLDLLGIEPEQLQVEMSAEVTNEYGRFAGKALECPADRRPSLEALRLRYRQFLHKLGREA